MSGVRAFDDDRWPDEEGFASCFVCGRKVDPSDPRRGTYTMNASACEPIPAHLDCLEGCGADEAKTVRIQVAFMTAINQMSAEQIKRFRLLARVAAVSPIGT